MKYSLNGPWNLSYTDPDSDQKIRINITVPGNVETAMLENGLSGDFMPADDIFSHEKYDWVNDWTFERSFTSPTVNKHERLFLNFEGIDTVAEIFLNGQLIYFADDMYIAHVIDVTDKVKNGENTLKVVIKSALLEAGKYKPDMFSQPRLFPSPLGIYGGQSYLRKARHEWGWDNSPRLLTAGLYRSVYLETLPTERFDEIYVYTKKVTNESVAVGASWNFLTESASLYGYSIRATLSQNGKALCTNEFRALFFRGVTNFNLNRKDVELWWPRGYGSQGLVDIKLELIKDGIVTAEKTVRYGIRTLKLEYSDRVDENGNGEFVFICNGEKIYISGANWKPLDPLHSRADAKVEKALDLAYDLNCNMIRIWGGGIYEDTPFFDYCDEKGILVWQDFMLGCEIPPNAQEYLDKVYDESEKIIKKLRNHPSLAVWCGDNENDISLNWSTYYGSNILPSQIKISRKTLPECIINNDPYRSFVPSSPYISDEVHVRNQKGDFRIVSPETHLYPPAIEAEKALRECKSIFLGETGPIGISAMTDNPRIFEREKARCERLWDKSYVFGVDVHQSDDYFRAWRQKGREICIKTYGRDFSVSEKDDYCIALNVICSGIFKDLIEYCRAERPRKTGVIWWSMLDMWPMLFNYSIVDSDFVKKMPYYWIKQSQQSFALMVVRKQLGGALGLYSANDTLCKKQGEYKITAISESGEERLAASGNFASEKNVTTFIGEISEGEKQELWIIEWTDAAKTCYNHFITGERPYSYEAVKSWSNRLLDLYK